MARSCQPQAVSVSPSGTAASARDACTRWVTPRSSALCRCGAERRERVHLAAQVGVRRSRGPPWRRGHRGGELGHPAQVDQRAEALHRARTPGSSGRWSSARTPVEDRQRLGGPPALLQVPGLPQLLDVCPRAGPANSTGASHRRDSPLARPGRSPPHTTFHDYAVTPPREHPSEADGPHSVGSGAGQGHCGRLAAAGVASPRVDAELLAAHVLGVGRGRLLLIDTVRGDRAAAGSPSWSRGGPARIPLQHLLGTAAVPAPGAGGRRRGVRAAAGDRAAGRLGDRAAPRRARRWSTCAAVRARSRSSVADEAAPGRVIAVERSPAALGYLRRNAAGVPRGRGGRGRRHRSGPARRSCRRGSTWCCATRRTCRTAPPCRRRWPTTTRPRRCSAAPDGLAVIRPVIALAAAAAAARRGGRHRARRRARRRGAGAAARRRPVHRGRPRTRT